MKPLPSLSLLLAASLSATGSLTAQDQANGKPVNPPAATPATGSTTTTVTEETNTRVVFPDTTLDKLDGKVARMDGEKKQLLLRTKNGKEPIPYSLNLTTKFLDLDGLPVNPALIIEEVPVEVRYVEKGTELIASTVVVQRYQAPVPGGGVTLTTRETLKTGAPGIEQPAKATATSRSGTLASMEKGILTVTGAAGTAPRSYQYSALTQWVNAAGEPLPLATIKPGYSVQVNYSQRGTLEFAERIVVMPPGKEAAPGLVPAPAPDFAPAPAPAAGALPAPAAQNPARN